MSESQASYQACRARFDTPEAAKTYSTRHHSSRKNLRERECIRKALAELPPRALVLDLPCGTGRLTYFIQQLGFKVLGADYSKHMLHYAEQYCAPSTANGICFEQHDVMNINHPDNTFDAVVCNRLFHHYATPELRQRALKELARVTRGSIIVSFFNSYSLSGLWSQLKNYIKKKKAVDRMPIPFRLFKQDIKSCGLSIEAVYYARWGISSQTYVKLKKDDFKERK